MADLGNLWFSLGLDDSKFEKQWKAAFNKYKNDAKIKVDFQIDSKTIKELQKFKDAGLTPKEARQYAQLASSVMQVSTALEKYNRELEKTKALQNESNAKITRQDTESSARIARQDSEKEARVNRQNAESLLRQKLTQEKINDYINKRAQANNKVSKGYQDQSLWLQNLKTLAANYFSLYAVKNFVTELARVSGEFEKQRVTLQAMVGEMEGLDIYNKVKELAVVSPFEFKDLSGYTKQLAAFSVPYEELYDTTKRLADISAGLGVDMSRIILAYGQIRSAGVLRGTELRQLTEAGVPILEKLAEKFEQLEGKAVSVGDVFGKISKKMVSFEMVKDIFTDLTSEGGKFYNMQEIQAETLSGKISNLKDAYSIMLSEIGGQTEGTLKRGVEWLYKMIDNWETVGTTVLSIASAFGVYQAAQAAAFATEKLNLIRQFAKAFLDAGFNIKKAAESMAALNLATKGGVWGVILGVLAGIGTALYSAHQNANRFNKELDDIFNRQTTKLEQEERALNKIKDALDGAAQGSQNRRDAINQFNSQFGAYMQNMLKETSTANELAIAYNNVAEGIKNRNKQEALANANMAIEEEYGSKVAGTLKELKQSLMGKGLSSSEAGDVLALLKDYYAKGGNQVKEINNIISDRIGEKLFKESNLGVSNALTSKLTSTLRIQVQEYEAALKKAIEDVDLRFNANLYSTKEEANFVNRIEAIYNQKLSQLRAQEGLSQIEFDKQAKALESLKLQELAEGFGAMGLPKIAEKYLKQWEQLTKITTGWRADIAKITASFNTDNIKVPTIFNPKDNETWLEYVKRIKDEYKDIKESISNLGSDPDKELPALEAQRKALEAVAKAYKIVLDEKGKKKEETDNQKKELNNLKDRYNWILKISEAYNKLLKQDATPEIAQSAVTSTFKDVPKEIMDALKGNTDWTAWFVSEFSRIADEAGKIGSDAGDEFQNALLQRLGSTDLKEVINALKLGEEIKKGLENWGLGDFALTGEGVTLDISKALKEQAVADNEAFARRKEILDKIAKAEKGDAAEIAALKKMYGDKWLEEAKARANELYELEVANNRKIAEDKIKEMGKAYAKESRDIIFSPDFFSNLGEKTLTQLEDASNKLKEMMNSPAFLMDEDYLNKVASGELSQDQIDEHIKQWRIYFDLLRSDVDIQHFEKVKKRLVESGKALSNVIDSVKEFADVDSVLGGLLDGLGVAVDAATTIADSFERTTETNEETSAVTELTKINWSNMAAAALQVAVAVVKNIFAAKQYREEMQRAADSFQQSIVSSRRELKIAGDEFETIFGENLVSAFEADSKAISDIVRELKNATSSVANMKIMTRKGFFGIGKQYTTLKDLAPQLFKADGSVNYEYLDDFLDAYGDKMSESQKILLENLKNSYEQYQDAMADTSDYLSGIFSDTASTIADRMLESFALTGNAATELGDLVGGVAKQMAKDLIQSLLVDQYLQPAMDRIKSLYNPQDKAFEEDSVLRTQKAILTMQDAINAAGQAVPEVNKLLQAISDMGIDLTGDAENASQVLSGLNEDQQNLLVSYINGIRADVSMNKGLLTSIVNSVGTINNNIATAIVVWKQIEANTHRSADGVDRIIGFFESVMGPYDGGNGQAFQVNIA